MGQLQHKTRTTRGEELQLPHPFHLAVLVAAMFALTLAVTLASAAETAPAREAELIRFVRLDCGSCHGLTLNGGLGPPLVAAALADKPADYLKQVILYGRPGTPMPPWRAFLTEAEADWIVKHLLKGFPDAR